jgi:uncharacterized membrane protein YeaQ/YmgE (transglycosylase-associated protein family)
MLPASTERNRCGGSIQVIVPNHGVTMRARRPGKDHTGPPGTMEGVKGMGVLGWIVLGLIAGAIAKLIMPGDDPGGIIVTMLLGIIGAVIGGYLGSRIFGIGLQTFWSLQTWIVAIIGSLILLGIYRLIAGRRAASR